ncbi:MAG: nucleoside monophosphate kinase [Candidatus Paceibacterota bacterium]|nr:MAG: nucleoside monophosphate kinase [Candidatus Paceibacterota bacterium]
MRTRTFMFFGPSGSGKGTQAKLLIDFLENKQGRKVIYIETGQKIREFIINGGYTSRLTKEIIDKGGLLPAFLPVWLWTSHLNENFTGEEDLVLDGLCRRPYEAPVLDSALKFYKLDKPFVVSLNVSRDWSMERLKSRGRKDDTEEYINSRLDWYEKEVAPSVDFFRNNPDYNLLEINGEQPIEKVYEEIIQKSGI